MATPGPITVRVDPTRIPRPNGQDNTSDQDFAAQLAAAEVETGLPTEAQLVTQRVDARNPQAPQREVPRPTPAEQDAAPETSTEEETASSPRRKTAAAASTPTDEAHTEEGPDWRIHAGKQAGSSSPLSQGTPSQGDPVEVAAGLAAGAGAPGQTPALPVSASLRSDAVQALGSMTNKGGEPTGQSLLQGARLGTRLRRGAPAPAQAPARTYDHKMLERAEQARASIFKQISLQLSKDGGQVMMRIDPPELGKLDLRMQVAEGRVTRLHIAAERAEVAQVIERHMPELRAILAQQGLSIDEAEVQSFDFHAADQQGFGPGAEQQERSPENGEQDHDEQRAPAPLSFISDEGLDFWI